MDRILEAGTVLYKGTTQKLPIAIRTYPDNMTSEEWNKVREELNSAIGIRKPEDWEKYRINIPGYRSDVDVPPMYRRAPEKTTLPVRARPYNDFGSKEEWEKLTKELNSLMGIRKPEDWEKYRINIPGYRK